MLDMGTDINERSSDGTIALLQAVFYNHLSCVKILMEGGADTTIFTSQGRGVLHWAARQSADCEIMKFLLDHAVEP